MMRLTVILMTVAVCSSPVRTQPSATYTVTFEAVWNSTTHPTDFPSNAHFSGLIGATHDSSVHFWERGELSTAGIQNMAEKGSKSPLDAEIDSAIMTGAAESLLSGDGTSSPGSVSLDFSIYATHSLVTLVTMVAPSPDWFAGVAGLQLFQNGSWIDTTVQLYPWDAGTDDGATFASADSPSSPHVPITEITGTPFNGTPPVGTFTFTRTSATSVPGHSVPSTFALQQNYPNPFNPLTTIEYSVGASSGQPSAVSRIRLVVYNLLGQEVATLVHQAQAPGTYTVQFNAAVLSSGIYFYRLEAGDFVATRRLVLLK